MERQLKERLIGAAVLVVLGVWLIPWVLDGANPPEVEAAGQEAVALELPVPAGATTEPLRRQTIELAATQRGEPQGVPADEAAAGDSERTDVTPQPAAEATAVPAAPTADRAAARATPTGATPRSTPASDVADAWLVQTGSFGDAANAERQASRIRAFGHDVKIYPVTANGRVMYRVRVGRFATRQQAEAAGSALSVHGFPAQIVPPE